MDDKPLFPLYVCLDDGEVIRVEAFDRILYHLEAIDIENNEYMFWDAAGHRLKVLITKGEVVGFEKAENKGTLQQASDEYAGQLAKKEAVADTTGTPEEIWTKLQKAKESLRSAGFFSRLFRGLTE